MTMTKQRSAAAAGPLSGGPVATPVVPRGKRRWGVMAGGACLALVGGLAATWLAAGAGDRDAVLVLARDLPAGTVLAAGDVVEALVAVDAGVATVAADDVSSVLGMVAVSALPQGSVLAPGDLVASGPPQAGEVVVPLPVPGTGMPAGGLRPGDKLLVVDTPPAQADPTPGDPQVFAVTVVTVGAPDVNGVSVVDVVAAQSDGAQVAKRAATGRFVLLVQPIDGAVP